MATKTNETQANGRPLVRVGERALLFSHHQYRHARAQGRGVEDYDVLMRRPEDDGSEGAGSPEKERWTTVPAAKYLKHRAIGWREAESEQELPSEWREQAEGQGAFRVAEPTKKGGE